MRTPGLPANFESHVTAQGNYAVTIETASVIVNEVWTPWHALAIANDIYAKMKPMAKVVLIDESNAQGQLGHPKVNQTQ